MQNFQKILKVIGVIAFVIITIFILDYFLEVALGAWNNPI